MRIVMILSLGIFLLPGGINMIECHSSSTNPANAASSSNSPSNTTNDKDKQAAQFDCLPDEVTLKDVVTYRSNAKKNVTVKDKLIELKAQCENGKLVDKRQKEIRFFRVQCWGAPPADYRERQRRQQDELKELEKKYTVVVMGCNRSTV